MATAIANLHVLIGANIEGLKKGLADAGRSITKVGRDFKKTGESLTKGITLPIAGLGIAATKTAIDFESSFAGIRKTMDLTEAQFGQLAQANRDLAKEIPVSVNELNRIGELAGQLGIRGVDNVIKFERTIAQLAVTTDLTADDAALAFAQIANVLQLPQDQIDRLGAAVVGLGNNFATVETSIVEFAKRISGAGKLVGLSAGDVAGIGTAFASLGVEAEAGGTAIQKVLLSMQTAVVQGGDALETFAATAGVSTAAFADLFRADAGQAFVAFVEGLGEQGEQAINTLDALDLKDQRLTRGFLAAAGAGDLLARAVAQGNAEFEANTALVTEAAKRFGTTESQMQLFLNAVKDIGITLGSALIPALTSAFDAAKPVIGAIAGIADAFAKADPAVQNMVLVMTAAFAASGPILFTVGAFIAALGAIAWPVVLGVAAVIAALGAITFAWSKWGDDIKGFITATIGVIKEFVVTVKDFFVGGITAAVDAVTGTVQKVAGAFAWLKDVVVGNSFVPEMVDAIKAQFDRLDDVMVKPAVEATVAVADSFARMGNVWVERIPNSVVTAATAIKGFGDVNRDEALRAAQSWLDMQQVLESFKDLGIRFVDQFASAFADMATGSADAFKNFVKSAIQQLTALIAKILVVKALGAIFPSFGSLFGGFFAQGGFLPAGSFGIVGERGPELVTAGPAGAAIQPMGNLTLSVDSSSLPPFPRAVTPDALAVDDYWRRFFHAATLDFRDRGGRF